MPEVDAPRFRGVLHQFAFFVATGAGAALCLLAPWHPALVVYAISLATMLGVSAAYHRGTWSARAQRWWQRADHAAIFVFIAGSYTPVCTLAMPPDAGRALLIAVWVGAGLGVLRALAWPSAPRWVVAANYVALGWCLILALPAVLAATGVTLLAVILVGGALYTIGAVIYAAAWPDPWPRTFGYHEVFHALTIAAATIHYGVIATLVRS